MQSGEWLEILSISRFSKSRFALYFNLITSFDYLLLIIFNIKYKIKLKYVTRFVCTISNQIRQ